MCSSKQVTLLFSAAPGLQSAVTVVESHVCESKIVPDQTILRVKQSDEQLVIIFHELSYK